MIGAIVGNRGGVLFVNATQTDAGSATTPAIYTLPNHTFRSLGPAGLMVLNVTAASDATVTGVNIVVNQQTLALTDASGNALTTLPAGKILVAFSKVSNTLNQL